MISYFGLYLLNRWFVMGDINLFKMLFGKRIRLEVNVVRIKLFCKYIGRSSIDDRMIIM